MSIVMTNSSSQQVIGIFAIQGAVTEHADCVRKCGAAVKEVHILYQIVNVTILQEELTICNNQLIRSNRNSIESCVALHYPMLFHSLYSASKYVCTVD